MNKRLKIAVCAVLILLALGVTLYPLISNMAGEKYRSLVETKYDKAVEKLNTLELIAEKEKAVEYNVILRSVSGTVYSKEALAQAEASYSGLLNVRGDGIMGYVQIPKIGVELPIYHGTAEETLDRGVGHLLGSSLPVGGIGTHCVLTGHSGLAGTRMFSDLDQLQLGDVFYLKVLDETHAYTIMSINTVLPEDTSELAIDPTRDSVTLITCTPFGINTHRLLVRGERIENSMAERIVEENGTLEIAAASSTWTEEYLKGIGLGCLGIIGLSGLFLALHVLVMRKKDARTERPPVRKISHAPRPEQKRGRHEIS